MGPQSSLFGLINSAQAGELVPQEMFDQIENFEGRRLLAYDDKTSLPVTQAPVQGKVTVGVGFNLERAGARRTIERLGVNFDDLFSGRVQLTNDQVNQLLAADLIEARAATVKIFPDFGSYSPARQRALWDMVYNMGATSFRGFGGLIKAAKSGNWELAADEAKYVDGKKKTTLSKWYRDVGPRRADPIIEMLRNG